MHVPFQTLPEDTRIWIYQSDKKISPDHQQIIFESLYSFTQQWEVHGTPMNTSFDIRFNHFVILAAQDQASGCSIDTSVRVMKTLGDKTGIDFFNRNRVAFKGETDVMLLALHELKPKAAEKVWDASTLFFNNVIGTKKQLDNEWIVQAGDTWLKRYLPKEILTIS
jgi:hypothetical protein